VLERLTPPGLVAPAAWQRLLHAADSLPPSSGGGIECHLTDPDRADLAVRYLEEELPAVTQAAATAPLSGFARLRAAATGHTGRRIAWLELDVPVAGAPVASVFAGPGYPPGGAPPAPPDSAEWDSILRSLWPAAPDATRAESRRLLACLPAGAWMGYLGLMRGGELRATISGVQPAAVPAFLARIGWPGDAARIAPTLEVALRSRCRLTLGLAVSDRIEAPLGIELGLDGADGWDALLAAAAALAPLPPAAAAALRAWGGQDGGVVRRLNHLKLGFKGAAPPSLKAYLYYGLV